MIKQKRVLSLLRDVVKDVSVPRNFKKVHCYDTTSSVRVGGTYSLCLRLLSGFLRKSTSLPFFATNLYSYAIVLLDYLLISGLKQAEERILTFSMFLIFTSRKNDSLSIISVFIGTMCRFI